MVQNCLFHSSLPRFTRQESRKEKRKETVTLSIIILLVLFHRKPLSFPAKRCLLAPTVPAESGFIRVVVVEGGMKKSVEKSFFARNRFICMTKSHFSFFAIYGATIYYRIYQQPKQTDPKPKMSYSVEYSYNSLSISLVSQCYFLHTSCSNYFELLVLLLVCGLLLSIESINHQR